MKKRLKTSHGASTMLTSSRSAYYNLLSVKLKNSYQKENQLHKTIINTFQQHRRRYGVGVRRLVVELKAKGIDIGSYQVRQVLHQNGLRAIQSIRS
jgi:hypothetical protein